MKIGTLITILMCVCVFTASGWVHLFFHYVKQKNRLNLIYSLLWMLFFFGNAFITYDNYVVQHKTPVPGLVAFRILVYLLATGATGIKIFKINFNI